MGNRLSTRLANLVVVSTIEILASQVYGRPVQR
jgi:hypothetical protein